ncbi:MAG: hypothetical protein WBB49_01665 [Microgenomates group bacterium]
MGEISSDGAFIKPSPDPITTQETLSNLGPEIPRDPQQIAQLLIDAKKLGIEGLDDKTSQLRLMRKPGSTDRWRQEPEDPINVVDSVVVALLHQGHDELASALLSCSKNELENLNWKIDNVVKDPKENAVLKLRLQKILEEKQAAVQAQLVQNGASEQVAQNVIHQVGFPEGALEISPEFWILFPTLPYEEQKILYTKWRSVEVTAIQITSIHEVGLDSFADLLVRNLDKTQTAEELHAYLNSAKKLYEVLQEDPIFENCSSERGYTFTGFFDFADPLLAYQTARDLFGNPDQAFDLRSYASQLQNIVNGYYIASKPHIEIDPEFISSWKTLTPLLTPLGDSNIWTEICSTAMREADRPLEFVLNFQKALPLLQKFNDQYPFLRWEYKDMKDPHQYLSAFDRIQPLLSGNTNPDLPMRLMGWLYIGGATEARIQTVLGAEERLHAYGLSLKMIGLGDFTSFVNQGEENIDNPQRDLVDQRFCENWIMVKECEDQYSEYVEHLPAGTWRSFVHIPRPDLQQFPKIIGRFQELGIDQSTAQRMFQSWSTYSAASRITYKDEEESSRTLTSQEKQRAIEDQVKHMTNEVAAITSYADIYGKAELNEIIQTFGLYNLSLYEVPHLHKQLLQWKTGDTPITNIVIGARTDWNGSSSNLGNDSIRAMGDEDAIFFEAGSEFEIAKILIAVGNHERQFGRDPLQTNAIRNVLIHAHANARGLALGPEGEDLDLHDYLDAEKRQAKIKGRANDYRKHLGNNFRILLQACSTAGETADGINIANRIAEYHNADVEGSPFITNGMLVINPDGSVTFNTTEGRIDSVTYSGK